MTGFLAQLGIREARVLAHSCPLGTSGRIHALRLRRRFPQPTVRGGGVRAQSTTAEAEQVLDEITDESIAKIQDEVRSKMRRSFKPPVSSQFADSELTINGEPLDIVQFAPHSFEKSKSPPVYRPSRKRESAVYDQFFYDYSQLLRQNKDFEEEGAPPPDIDPLVIAAEVSRILETGDHHTATIAIGRLAALPPFALSEIPAEDFTTLLKLMDPKFFFADHIRFDRYLPARNPFYVEFFGADWEWNHPRAIFLRLLFRIVKLRRHAGWELSQEDQLYMLQFRRVLGDVSKVPLNLQFHPTRKFPQDIESFNAVMGSLVEGGIWATNKGQMLKQITARYWPRDDEAAKVEQVNKSRISYVFEQLTNRGIIPNEETMCLMMTVFAREGDMEGIKHIFDSVWGINIYKFLALGEDGIGHTFAPDSPVRPSGRLLETIAHIFGTNQDIPLALRLMDFVSRRYDIPIPVSAWEEILQRTYTLSVYKKAERDHSTSPLHPRKPLPGTSVTSLWKTMVAQPYNVAPNIHMYDKIIRSLIGIQRFGLAEERMEEGRVMHKENVHRYACLLREYRHLDKASTTLAERIALDHKLWMANMELHRSRQYVRQWVRALIYRSDVNRWRKWENGDYMAGVVERWKLFLPKVVRYEVPSGRVELRHDALEENRERVRGRRRGEREARDGRGGEEMWDRVGERRGVELEQEGEPISWEEWEEEKRQRELEEDEW